MPVTRIESCRARSPEEVAALRQAVYEAQIEALKAQIIDGTIVVESSNSPQAG